MARDLNSASYPELCKFWKECKQLSPEWFAALEALWKHFPEQMKRGKQKTVKEWQATIKENVEIWDELSQKVAEEIPAEQSDSEE